jgi:hypothetical protein
MDYLETLLLIEERQESILAQDIRTLITTKHRYFRTEGVWSEDMYPGMPVEKYTKGGMIYVWNRLEEPNV